MKIILYSNPEIQSQTRYLPLCDARTYIDIAHVNNFPYSEISKMSLKEFDQVDPIKLNQQLTNLDEISSDKTWLLKTHCYFNFSWPVIDITVGLDFLPFLVKASLHKNSRSKNILSTYHPIISKIKDPKILYYFDCYNTAVDCLNTPQFDNQKLSLQNILGGWQSLKTSLQALEFHVDDACKILYNDWMESNQQFLPSKKYSGLINSTSVEVDTTDLSIEEQYCLLAINKHKFRLLDDHI